MTYRVIVTDAARQQLRDIAHWYFVQSGSTDLARQWFEGFWDALKSLTDHPQRCPLARENGQSASELRELLYGIGKRVTHRAIFRIRSESVEILAIRHVAQRNLPPEGL